MKFAELVRVFEEMEGKSSRLALTDDLAALLKKCSPGEAKRVSYLIQGIIAPPHAGIEVGMAERLAMRSIEIVSGKSAKEIEGTYRKKGDLGDAALELLKARSQRALARQELTVGKVYENFYKIATSGGEGSQDLKIKLLAELLSNAEPNEAKILVRFVTGSLRLGVGDSTIIDALSVLEKGDKSLHDEIERAYNLTSDLGMVAELFLSKGTEAVKKIKPVAFSPIRPALAERLEDAKAIIEKIGECAAEGKYDGFRLQIHKKGERIELYSRKQERITPMFPDLLPEIKKRLKAKEVICEGEAIAFNESTGTFLPFQETIQRKRKHDVAEKADELPLKLFLFELLYLDGDDWTLKPYKERRARLARLVNEGGRIELAKNVIAKDAVRLQRFFDECVEAGLEGIVAKDLNAPYTAGARKFAWIKLKKSYSAKLADTLDVVIIGYYFGKGKRTQFGFGGLLTAAYDDKEKRFRSIAKIGTGFSEEQMKAFRESLSKIAVKKKPDNVDSLLEPDEWVHPRLVVEVKADELTKSPVHLCCSHGKEGEGLALRFPRLVKVRSDKKAEDATTEKEVLEMFELQQQRAKHAKVE